MSDEVYSVRVVGDVPTRITAALASMSATFRASGDGPRTLIVGDGPWPAAEVAAADAVLVVGVPRDAPRASTAPTVVELGWNHDPAAALAASDFSRRLDADALLEVTTTGPAASDPERVLVGQLALLRTIAGPVHDLRPIRSDAGGYDVLGALAPEGRVALAALFSDALREETSVRLVAPRATVELRLPAPDLAAPGLVRITDDAGSRTMPTLWERSARRALQLLTDGGDPAALPALLHDLEQVGALGLVPDTR